MKKNNGFTLVEILVIIGILSIILMMAISIGNQPMLNSRFTSIINNFLADFNQARTLAATENRYVAVIFDGAGKSYEIWKQTNITDFVNFTHIKTVTPNEGKFCFKTGEVQSFAINSMGEVRSYPIDGSPPTQVQQSFYISFLRSGKEKLAYKSRLTIFPYGGIKVDKLPVQ